MHKTWDFKGMGILNQMRLWRFETSRTTTVATEPEPQLLNMFISLFGDDVDIDLVTNGGQVT